MQKGEWIFGRGWHETDFSDAGMPNKEDLDKIAPDYQVNLVRSCGHVAAVNSKALEIAGITKFTPDPPGGKILRSGDGEPSGILAENAIFLINKAMPPLNKERIKHLLLTACKEARKHGVLTVQSEDFKAPGSYKYVIQAYRELAKEGTLPVKVEEQMYFNTPQEIADF